jgi:hypothetical protein
VNKANSFTKVMAAKTDIELLEYVEKKSRFQERAVLAASWELEKRGRTTEDVKKLIVELEKKESFAESESIVKPKPSNVTEDPNAPLLYSPKFILVYGALFSVLFGGILMAVNFARLGKQKLAWMVALSALLYSVLQGTLLNSIDQDMLTVPLTILGVYLLEQLIWKPNVSPDLKYRKRKIWIPLLIAIGIWGPIFYLIITGG